MHIPVYKHISGKRHPDVVVGRRLGSGTGTLYAFVLSDFFFKSIFIHYLYKSFKLCISKPYKESFSNKEWRKFIFLQTLEVTLEIRCGLMSSDTVSPDFGLLPQRLS